MKENNLFPPLNFPNDANNRLQQSNKDPMDNLSVKPRRSSRIKAMQPLNDVMIEEQQKKKELHIEKNQFLFSLGSPKPSTVSGKVLVCETPESQMFERRMLDRRLRNGLQNNAR